MQGPLLPTAPSLYVKELALLADHLRTLMHHSEALLACMNRQAGNLMSALRTCHQLLGTVRTGLPVETTRQDTTLVNDIESCIRLVQLTLVQTQSYDIANQRVQHLQWVYQENTFAIDDWLGRCDVRDYPAVLNILSEIISLHTAQLLELNQDYQTDLATRKQRLKQLQCQVGQATSAHSLVTTVQVRLNELLEYPAGTVGGAETFGELVQAMLTELDKINQLVALPPTNCPARRKAELLNAIRKRYTMQSERSLHDRVLGQQSLLNRQQTKLGHTGREEVSGSPEDEEDGIELF